jgi:hypothetical protein
MKILFATCLIVGASWSTLAWSSDAPATGHGNNGPLRGTVLEVKDVDSYTYLRIKTKDAETWAAVERTTLKKGATVTIENPMVMNNFESKALKKTFPSIVFGTLAGSNKDAATATASAGTGAGVAKIADTAPIMVSKASGPNGHTVAEVVLKSQALKDKQVVIHAKVVKFSPAIMGKNWIHLRDGSGSAADNNNDILVTSAEKVNVGDVVTLKGVVRVNKDFGAGYSYKVLIEEGIVQR